MRDQVFAYTEDLANKGWRRAIREDSGLARGVNTVEGKVTYSAVAQAHGLEETPLDQILGEEP